MWRMAVLAILVAACGGDEGLQADAALSADAASLVADSAAPDAAAPDAGNSLTITPAATDFGFVVIGAHSANVTFTVASTAATGPVIVSTTGSPDFAIVSNGCAAGLAAGATCAVVANLTPASAGVRTATLTVSADPGGTATATLRGLACSTASLTITPNLNNFGSVTVGQSSAPVTFTVNNPGCVPTGVPTAALMGTDASLFTLASNGCTASLAAMGGSCTVSVSFAPTTAGNKSTTLSVFATPGGTAAATLNGTGTP